VPGTCVIEEAGSLWNILLGTSSLWNPDHVSPQVRRTGFLEQVLIDFGGPPKTRPSSGRDEHQDPYSPSIGVKRGTECGCFAVEPFVSSDFAACLATTESDQG
jgi:hypothetical protein